MKAIWENTVLAESDRTIVIEDSHYFPPDWRGVAVVESSTALHAHLKPASCMAENSEGECCSIVRGWSDSSSLSDHDPILPWRTKRPEFRSFRKSC